MKIDQQYIDSLTEEYTSGEIDRKTAKQKLTDYAKESFNFDLNKQKSFENMIVQLKEMVDNYVEPPMDDQDGISIKDLITAADQLDGKSVFDDATKESLELLSGVSYDEIKPDLVIKTPQPQVIKPEIIDKPEEVLKEKELEVKEEIKPQEYIPKTSKYVLPEGFTPTIALMGKAPGYYTLPWWIYKWILENEDWKDRPDECPENSAINILKSLIYFINKDGQIRIRETRNSRFYVLK